MGMMEWYIDGVESLGGDTVVCILHVVFVFVAYLV